MFRSSREILQHKVIDRSCAHAWGPKENGDLRQKHGGEGGGGESQACQSMFIASTSEES